MKKLHWIKISASIALIVAGGYHGIQGQTQVTVLPQPVTSPRPLVDVKKALQERYGKPVTYEETFLTAQGDLRPMGSKGDLVAKDMSFQIPGEADAKGEMLGAAQRAVDAYHQGTQGTRYRILQSSLGFHLIPAQIRDASGNWAPAVNLLDAVITVPEESRIPSKHFAAFEAALAAATGIRLITPGLQNPNGFDEYFAVEPAPFSWGVSKQSAREALIGLLSQAATTYSWEVRCQNAVQPQNRECIVSVARVQVAVKGPEGKVTKKNLEWDRCPKCTTVQ